MANLIDPTDPVWREIVYTLTLKWSGERLTQTAARWDEINYKAANAMRQIRDTEDHG